MKAIITLLFLLMPKFISAQTLSFRTDGYYLYDNEQDTLFLFHTDNKEGGEILDLFKFVNLTLEKPVSWAKNSPCLPDNTVATGNSSRLEILAFFSDYMGNSSTAVCWNEKVYQQFARETQKAKSAFLDKSVSFLDPAAPNMRITLKGDNSFVIRRGFSTSPASGDKLDPRPLPEKITGRLYRDKIIVDRIDFESSHAEFAKLLNQYRKYPFVFKFYKFGQMPKAKSPHLVYKEGSLWN